MRGFSLLLVFILAFCAACIGILTFLQPAFHAPAGIIIFSYHTKEYPVYYFILGALALGGAIGCFLALYYRVRYGLMLSKADKNIASLEQTLSDLTIAQSHAPSFVVPTPPSEVRG